MIDGEDNAEAGTEPSQNDGNPREQKVSQSMIWLRMMRLEPYLDPVPSRLVFNSHTLKWNTRYIASSPGPTFHLSNAAPRLQAQPPTFLVLQH